MDNGLFDDDNSNAGFFGGLATPAKKKHPGFFGGLASDVENVGKDIVDLPSNIVHGVSKAAGAAVHDTAAVAHGAGTFFGGIASSIYDDAVSTGKTVKNIGQSLYDNYEDPKKIASNVATYKQATDDYNNHKITLAQLNEAYKTFQTNSQVIGNNLKNEGINTDKETPLHQGAAAANTFINLATLGIGSGVKALAAGGVKDVVKEVAENGLASGAKKAVQVVASNGANEADRQALADEVAKGGGPAAQAALAHFGNEVVGNATLGGAQGAIQSEDTNNPSGNMTHDALLGALTGGALGTGGSLLNRDVRTGLAQVPGELGDKINTAAEALKARTPALNEAGAVSLGGDASAHVRAPEPATPEATKQADELAQKWTDLHAEMQDTAQEGQTKLPDGTIQLNPLAETKVAMLAKQTDDLRDQITKLDPNHDLALQPEEPGAGTIGGPRPDLSDRPGNAVPSPDDETAQLDREKTPEQQQQESLVNDIAGHYKTPEQYIEASVQEARGMDAGQRGGDMQPTADGGFIRTSSHTKFYSDYYKEYHRPPSIAAIRDQVTQALETGGDGGGLIHPGESDVYKAIKDRQADQNALASDPAGGYEAMRQQHLAALNGDDTSGNIPTDVGPPAPAPEPQGGSNQRAFLQSAQEDKTATPALKQSLADVKPQDYETRPQQPLVDNANKMIDDDPEAAAAHVLTTKSLNDQDIATGYQLMGKLSRANKTDEATTIALHMDNSLRESGRAVKAADIVGNLSPEGVLRYAAKKIRQGREAVNKGRAFSKGTGAEGDVGRDIHDQVEGAGEVTKDDVTDAIRDTVNSRPPAGLPAKPGEGQLDLEGNAHTEGDEEVTTGQKIANRVEKQVTPQVKKKADTLVDEVTKKIKQQMLEPKEGAPKKNALDILREVFSRNDEAQEAYPEAQRILQEKMANNPKALKLLDKFFNSELGVPHADSTLDTAITDQLRTNETKIADIIHQSWNGQKQSVQDVADALTKEGFDKESAATISKEVVDRLSNGVANAKISTLERLAQDAPKKAKVTFLDKVNKLSNLGGLDNQDYLDLARAKLKLPNLTPDIAQDVSRLSQKMQDMPEGAARDDVAREIYTRIQDAIPKTKAQIAAEILSAPKSIMASYDLSGTLRQGGVLGARFRTEAKDAFKKQIHYFGSEENFNKDMSAIRHDPDYDLATRGNVALTGVDGAEEAFVSQLPEKIPILGRGVAASDRAYTGSLTQLRFSAFKHILNDLRASGIDPAGLGDEQLESIGKFINTSSGRGYGPKDGLFEKVAPALNRTLFSPRLWKSRLDMLNPRYYYKLDPIARKYALQSAGDFAAIAGVVLGLASLAGAKVQTDPRSSDFLKIRVGDTRYDILGGFQQNLVFAARELSGETKSSTSGNVSKLNSGKFDGQTRMSVLSSLVQNKENPIISTGSDLLNGTDSNGNPVNPKSELAKLVIPLNVQDTYTLSKDKDPFSALFGALVPGTLGVGVNTYSDNPTSSSTSQADEFSNGLFGR